MTDAQTQAIVQIDAAVAALAKAKENITIGNVPSIVGAAGKLGEAARAIVVASVYVGQAQRGG